MKRLWIGFGAFAAMPALAQTITPMPAPAADYAAMSVEDLAGQLRGLNDDASVCSQVFPILSEIARQRTDLTDIATQAQRAEMFCANERSDFATAYGILKANPAVAASINGLFALYLTSMGGEGAAFPAAFERVFAGKDDSLENLEPELLNQVLHKARELGAIEAVDALALQAVRRPETLARLQPDVRPILSYRALAAAARAGDVAGARSLLDAIDDPVMFDSLLGERMYKAIWPAVEARVGPNYTRITPAFLAGAMKRYNAEPDRASKLNDAAHSLYYDGRYAEVIAFADKATARPDLAETMTGDEGWAINLKAYALDALERRAEADSVFDRLAKASTRHKSWGVNFVINRALRLAGQERWAPALTAAAEAQAISDEFGSDYAKGLVAYAQVCALRGLGRTSETANPLSVLKDKSAQHPGNYASALQCLGRSDQAAEVLIAAIADPKTRSGVLRDLQPVAMDMFYTRSALPHPRDLLATHPRLREAFLARARVIPEEYWPAASLKR